jgi:ABC-type phosphate transport system permease subunit
MSLGLIALMWILWTLFPGLQRSWELFTQDTPAPGSKEWLRNAIVGMTHLVVFHAGCDAGRHLAGIYLAEYGRFQICFFYLFHDHIMLSALSIVIILCCLL